MEQNEEKKNVVIDLFTEFRYTTSPNFFDAKEKIFKELVEQYPNYNMDKIDVLVMHSKEFPGTEIQIMPNRFIVKFENGGDFKVFAQVSNKVWEIVNKYMKIRIIERIGVRTVTGVPSPQNTAKEKIEKLLSKDIDKSNLFNAQIVLNFRDTDGGTKVSINNGIIQTISVAQVQTQPFVLEGIIADIDTYYENIFSHHVNAKLSASVGNFDKYLKLID